MGSILTGCWAFFSFHHHKVSLNRSLEEVQHVCFSYLKKLMPSWAAWGKTSLIIIVWESKKSPFLQILLQRIWCQNNRHVAAWTVLNRLVVDGPVQGRGRLRPFRGAIDRDPIADVIDALAAGNSRPGSRQNWKSTETVSASFDQTLGPVRSNNLADGVFQECLKLLFQPP